MAQNLYAWIWLTPVITSGSTCISGPVQATAWCWNTRQTWLLGDEFKRVAREWNGVRLLECGLKRKMSRHIISCLPWPQKQAMTSSWCLKGNPKTKTDSIALLIIVSVDSLVKGYKHGVNDETQEWLHQKRKRIKNRIGGVEFPSREARITDIEIAVEPSCFTHIQKKKKKSHYECLRI